MANGIEVFGERCAVQICDLDDDRAHIFSGRSDAAAAQDCDIRNRAAGNRAGAYQVHVGNLERDARTLQGDESGIFTCRRDYSSDGHGQRRLGAGQ